MFDCKCDGCGFNSHLEGGVEFRYSIIDVSKKLSEEGSVLTLILEVNSKSEETLYSFC